MEKGIETYLFEELGINELSIKVSSSRMEFSDWSKVDVWGVDKLLRGGNKDILRSNIYENKRLDELAYVNPKTNFRILDDSLPISFVPMECVSDTYGEIEEDRIGIVGQSNGYTKFQEKDLIWAKITPCMENGKSAIVDELVNGYGYGSTEYHVVRSKENNLRIPFVYNLLRTKAVRKDAVNYFSGTAGQQRVPKSYLEGLVIPIPPLWKQIEIEEKIALTKEAIKKARNQNVAEGMKAIEDFEAELFAA